MIIDPLCFFFFFAMDSVLYASMHVLDVEECNMPHVCDNVSMGMIVMLCYVNLWVLLIFLTLNSLRIMLRSFKRI